MRSIVLAAVPFCLLGGCAGNVADYIGPRAPIITPQLARFGLDAETTQCVGLRLGDSLSPLQLRRFARLAGAVRQSYFGSPELGLRDLRYVASRVESPEVESELESALSECAAESPSLESAEETASGTADAAPRGPTWLNLGAAGSGQSIAVDASSLRQDGNHRTAWFRLTNPDASVATGITYLLRIDCSARTISPQADRRQDAEGRIVESREYGADEQGPLPIEGGTVMEIAYLSLCT